MNTMVAMRRKGRLLGVGLVLACALAGGSLWWHRVQEQKKAARAAQASAAEAEAAARAIPHGDISLQGTISAREVVNVPSPIDGLVVRFHADTGDEVYQGQLLAEILNNNLATAQETAATELEKAQERVNTLEASLAAARLETSRAEADAQRVKAELDRATKAYTRQKMLLEQGATPRLVFQRAEAEYKTLLTDNVTRDEVAKGAQARFASLQRDLDNARKDLDRKGQDVDAARARVDAGQVVSPANGVVLSRRGAPGEEVHPTMEDLFRIATDLSQLTVTVEPRPAVLSRIVPGMPALIHVADIPGEALNGTVRSIEGGRVLIDFGSPSPIVRPGVTAQVELRLP